MDRIDKNNLIESTKKRDDIIDLFGQIWIYIKNLKKAVSSYLLF